MVKSWASLDVDFANTTKTYQKIVGVPGTIPQSLSALVQGFPSSWKFSGPKRSVAQQIVNACPPPLAKAIGLALRTTVDPKPVASTEQAGYRPIQEECTE